jgi:hypothetical protein
MVQAIQETLGETEISFGHFNKTLSRHCHRSAGPGMQFDEVFCETF